MGAYSWLYWWSYHIPQHVYIWHCHGCIFLALLVELPHTTTCLHMTLSWVHIPGSTGGVTTYHNMFTYDIVMGAYSWLYWWSYHIPQHVYIWHCHGCIFLALLVELPHIPQHVYIWHCHGCIFLALLVELPHTTTCLHMTLSWVHIPGSTGGVTTYHNMFTYDIVMGAYSWLYWWSYHIPQHVYIWHCHGCIFLALLVELPHTTTCLHMTLSWVHIPGSTGGVTTYHNMFTYDIVMGAYSWLYWWSYHIPQHVYIWHCHGCIFLALLVELPHTTTCLHMTLSWVHIPGSTGGVTTYHNMFTYDIVMGAYSWLYWWSYHIPQHVYIWHCHGCIFLALLVELPHTTTCLHMTLSWVHIPGSTGGVTTYHNMFTYGCPHVMDTYHNHDIEGFVQDCSNCSALAMQLLQSCTKPSTYPWPHSSPGKLWS